jgi:hypothetical protein
MYLDPERTEFFMTSKGLVFNPLLYRVTERRNRYLVPLNCGTEDAEGQSCFAILLESTEDNTYRRVSNSTKIGFPPPNVGGMGELESIGRKRICIQHDASLEWPVLERREYLIRFKHAPPVQKRCIKTIKMVTPQDLGGVWYQGSAGQSISTRNDVVMRLGTFAVAEFDMAIRGRDVKFGIAVRRCGDSVTLQAWLCSTTAEFESWVERTRPIPPQQSERQDTIELEPLPSCKIEVQLRPKRGRIVEIPNGERQRLETMVVSIALRESWALPMREL